MSSTRGAGSPSGRAAWAALVWPVAVFLTGVLFALPAAPAGAPATETSPPTANPTSLSTSGTPPTADPISPPASPATDALHLLETIAPAQQATPGYVRAAFGPGWGDPDRNGCDARNDVLARDLTEVVFRAGTRDCVVHSGILHDPYTGLTIDFLRGNTTSVLVQIDHVVPLAWAWSYGASGWTDRERADFHSDAANLLAVDGDVNQSKSAKGPSKWLPPNADFHCEYAITWVTVLSAYELTIPGDDRKELELVLRAC